MNRIFSGMFSDHPSIVGFDRIFESILEHQNNYIHSSYPPYNLLKDGNKYTVEMGVAGLSSDDIDIVLEAKAKENALLESMKINKEILV